MKPIIFYHVWQAPGWELLFQQQIMAMYQCGLYNAAETIYVCCNGQKVLPFDLPKFSIIYNKHTNIEADTLNQMWKLCQLNNINQPLLYIHTKGLSYQNNPTRTQVDAWRLYLEYYVIHKWQSCIEVLNQHDVVGTEWSQVPSIYVGTNKQIHANKNSGIFVGNFWWANSSYIKSLDPNFLYNYKAAHKIEGLKLSNICLSKEEQSQVLRFNSELWLGTQNPKVFSFNRLHEKFYDTNIMYRLEEFT